MTASKRAPGPAKGRPARSRAGAAQTYQVRLSPPERAIQLRLAAALECSRSEVLRKGLRQLCVANGVEWPEG